MESIASYFANFGLNFNGFLQVSAVILIGALLLNLICRFIFQKQTMLNRAISSSVAIIFIYVMTVVIMTAVPELRSFISPLPFISMASESLDLFAFQSAALPFIASEVFSMIILSLLVNFVDSWLPRGKNLLSWLLFRSLTVGVCFFAHYFIVLIFNKFCPELIVVYAPAALLVLLIVMLLTGALRFVVGLVLTTVNPIIAALYTFFFASIIGKRITTAVMTTAILSGIVYLMERMGVVSILLMAGAFVAYIPFLLMLVLVWFIVSRP